VLDGRQALALSSHRPQSRPARCSRTRIKITLIEIPPENWGLRGGMPASEIDLGFKIDV
jgi:hypothetical protein